MVKFAVVQISDGNFLISSEGYTDLNKARMAFHGLCKNLYSEAAQGSIKEGFTVLLMNDGGGIVEQESYVAPIQFDDMLAQSGMYVTEEPVESEV